MSFQQQVGLRQAPAVSGDKASLNPVVYAMGNPVAEGPVSAGSFVWAGSVAGRAKSSGTGQPLGLVERTLACVSLDPASEGSLLLPAGSPLTVARRGDYFVCAATAAEPGQKVFASLADGAIKTGAAGSAVDGAVETGWSVLTPAPAGEAFVISNWQ